MPSWIDQGVAHYAARMPTFCKLKLQALPLQKRGKKADIKALMKRETAQLLQAIPVAADCVALERTGKMISTEMLAEQLRKWLASGQQPVILIGGPEGLETTVLQKARAVWSLSALTMAHPVARLVLAEQLYRAISIIQGLPYHRGPKWQQNNTTSRLSENREPTVKNRTFARFPPDFR